MTTAPHYDPKNSLENRSPSAARIVSLVGVATIGIALFGFLVGIGEPIDPVRFQSDGPETTTDGIPSAPNYQQISEVSFGPNSDWETQFSTLEQNRPGLFDRVPRTNEMKLEALIDRQQTRAFEGAPPVVPHPITQQSAESCLVCHEHGLQLGDRLATRMSHARFTSCTQCHVESSPSGPFELEESLVNDFSGVVRSGPGKRAMAGSPPTIPHTTWLREDCLSCHGLVARPGLRTTHPWLSNCVQCHASSAEFDRLPFGPHSTQLGKTETGERHPLAKASEEQSP